MSMNIFDYIQKPDDVGASEYRAIYELLDDNDVFQDPEMAIAICEEFQDYAAIIITKLQEAMERVAREG